MGCGKVRHPTYESAVGHMGNLKNDPRDHWRRRQQLQVYHCPECKAFHVGHSRSIRATARARRR